jgi:hypothetical protein
MKRRVCEREVGIGPERHTPEKLGIGGRHPQRSRRMKLTVAIAKKHAELGLAHSHRVRQHGVKDRLETTR